MVDEEPGMRDGLAQLSSASFSRWISKGHTCRVVRIGDEQ